METGNDDPAGVDSEPGALLVRSRFGARLVRAALRLATGAVLEGVKP